jgi:hypothetical protein
MKRSIFLALLAAAFAFPAQAYAFEAEEVVLLEDPPAQSTIRGCRTVDVVRVGKTALGFVAYKFHHVKRWCWSFPHVTSASSSVYVSHVDPNYDYKGVISSSGGYYTWCCGTATSGHVSLRQGRFDNCPVILFSSCWRREYPWVRIWVRADGTYTYRTGL